MKTLEANGAQLNYEEIGIGSTVILIHGIPTDYRVWKSQVDGLYKHHRTISYSRRCAFPNHGDDYGNSTMENNVKDLEAMISETKDGMVHLVGHSYGGPVAALYTLRHPELVRSLVLIEPYLPGMIVGKENFLNNISLLIRKPSLAMSGLNSLNNIKTTIQEVSRSNKEQALNSYYSNTWEHGDIKVQLSATNRNLMMDNMETFKELLNEVPHFTKKDAVKIVPPTLILTGEHTTKYMKGVVTELKRSIPNNKVIMIQNASHYPHIESPMICTDELLKFFAEHDR